MPYSGIMDGERCSRSFSGEKDIGAYTFLLSMAWPIEKYEICRIDPISNLAHQSQSQSARRWRNCREQWVVYFGKVWLIQVPEASSRLQYRSSNGSPILLYISLIKAYRISPTWFLGWFDFSIPVMLFGRWLAPLCFHRGKRPVTCLNRPPKKWDGLMLVDVISVGEV